MVRKLNDIFEIVLNVRKLNNKIPIILMGYYNSIFNLGIENFTSKCAETGVDGLIIVDLQPEEDSELYSKTKEKNIDKGIMQNVYKTDIEPEFAAREVAAWADANGFQVYEMGPGIQQAWTMAIAAADEAEAQGIDVSITSLIPYLEEATIKQRLDNLKGVPPVSTARVNGNKIEMNPSELVILNGKIKNVTGDVNRFWNTVAKVYKGNDKESGTPWRKIFEQHVIDSGENITPFALFGQVYLENIMEGMANQ